ncbi:MAG: hypothetical protein QHH17_05385 [Candidatus Bathyarchaeota archaeon]|jgi:hypothetical protein|nr:hypothetical protein [Candidatus Bathyarchaeota archaeon]
MHADVEILTEIPCFKCLFWEPIKQSSLYCNPNECQKLTEWLLKNAENQQQEKVDLKVVPKSLLCAKK